MLKDFQYSTCSALKYDIVVKNQYQYYKLIHSIQKWSLVNSFQKIQKHGSLINTDQYIIEKVNKT